MNLTVFCSCEPASLKDIHLVFDALKSKLCEAAKSIHVLSIGFNAMLVGANNVTPSAQMNAPINMPFRWTPIPNSLSAKIS